MCPPCPPCPPVQSEDQLHANHKITLEMFVRKCGVPRVYQVAVQWLAIFSRYPPYSIPSTLCRLHTVYCPPRQSRCLMINMLRVVPILRNTAHIAAASIRNKYTIRSNHNHLDISTRHHIKECEARTPEYLSKILNIHFSSNQDNCRSVETKLQLVRWPGRSRDTAWPSAAVISSNIGLRKSRNG